MSGHPKLTDCYCRAYLNHDVLIKLEEVEPFCAWVRQENIKAIEKYWDARIKGLDDYRKDAQRELDNRVQSGSLNTQGMRDKVNDFKERRDYAKDRKAEEVQAARDRYNDHRDLFDR